MTFIVQRAADRTAVPWRNGMGVQYEITADGPLPDGWSWRLSTADLSPDVPFSVFAGVDREFCVAYGGGVILTIDGVTHRCAPGSITCFDGGATVCAVVIDGPLKALNLMVKHASSAKHLSIHRAGEAVESVEALVAVGDRARLLIDDVSVELDVLDAVLNVRQSTIVIVQGTVVVVR